jgi:Response regulator of the LytR/AlgR family
MNLFDEYRKSYITACLVLAVIYAFILGGLFSADFMESPESSSERVIFYLTDGLIYSVILYLAGIILWNIFRFAIPPVQSSVNQKIFLAILFIAASISITGVESFAVYLCFPSMFDSFTMTIPSRLFFSILIIIIIRLLYLFHHEKHFRNNPSSILEDPDEISVKKDESLAKDEKKIIDRITVRSAQNIKIIPVDEITFIKADGDYISINTANGRWLKEQTMKYTEDTLPADRFVRIHRSYIVNVNHISRIERYGEQQQVVLHNNEKIKISAARYQVLKQSLRL